MKAASRNSELSPLAGVKVRAAFSMSPFSHGLSKSSPHPNPQTSGAFAKDTIRLVEVLTYSTGESWLALNTLRRLVAYNSSSRSPFVEG